MPRNRLPLALMVMIALAGCAPSADEDAPKPSPPGPGLTGAALENTTYDLPLMTRGGLRLEDGRHVEPSTESGARTVVSLDEHVGRGDLNGDGKDEAAVILTTDLPGDELIHYLVVVGDRNGYPRQLARTRLGDRILVRSVEIEDGLIKLALTVHAPGEDLHHPTMKILKRYELRDRMLLDLTR